MFRSPLSNTEKNGMSVSSENTSQKMFMRNDKVSETVNDSDSDGGNFCKLLEEKCKVRPVPGAARSKAYVCGCCDRGFKSCWGHGCLFCVCVCCQVEVSATRWSLVQEESYRLWHVLVWQGGQIKTGRPAGQRLCAKINVGQKKIICWSLKTRCYQSVSITVCHLQRKKCAK
jgi:hypothetical protein